MTTHLMTPDERAKKTAQSIASIGQQKSPEYRAPKLSEHDAEHAHRQAQARKLK